MAKLRWEVGEGRADITRTRPQGRPIEVLAKPERVTLDPARTACIVVDMQNDFCSAGGWLDHIGVDTSPLREPIGPLEALLPALRSAQVPIIFLNWGNRPDRANLPPAILHVYDPDGTAIGIGDQLPNGSRVLEKGSWSAALVEGLEAGPDDLFIDKYRMTGFVDTELDSVLRNLDVSTLLFAGVNLDQCVFVTLADASARGFDCILIEDCCATTSPPGCAEATLYNVAQCFGFVATSTAVMAGLDARSQGTGSTAAESDSGIESEVVVEAALPTAPELRTLGRGVAHRITAGDTVKLVVLRRPDDLYDASVFLEIRDPGGSQPPNSHVGSVETFFFIDGEGIAYSDGTETAVSAHDLIVLRLGSLHRIENCGTGRLYAVTTMTPDAGFAALVESGPSELLDDADWSVLNPIRVV